MLKNAWGEVVVVSLVNGELLFETGKRVELVEGVEFLIVFAVAACNLTVVSWGVGLDKLVADAELCKGVFKESGLAFFAGNQAVGEFCSVVSLNTLNEKWELFGTAADERGRGIDTVLLDDFQIAETAEPIEESVLEHPALLSHLPHKTGGWNKLDIDLDTLAKMGHLYIGLKDILWIRQLYRQMTEFAEEPV